MIDDPKVAPLSPSDWDESLSHVLADMKGQPLNVHSLMAHHPALLKAWWSFRNYSVQGGQLGRRRGELVILRTAIHLKAWYEWASHVERGLVCGLGREEIERVKEGPTAAGWADDEAALLVAVDELNAQRALSAESQARLRAHFSVPQIMDVMAIHGMYVILGCMINTWGLDLDAQVAAKLPEDVTQEDFERAFPR
ncbi:MAG: carboxymuconolactone decarboxylase family protein [Pseudomonadota bacterium]